MNDRFNHILAVETEPAPSPEILGVSREERPLFGYRLGSGTLRVSLIAGCHADEPVGPRLLRAFVRYLSSLPADDVLLTKAEWWIVPDANPDGAERNRPWFAKRDEEYDIAEYLLGAVRELPGDDVEFGFPRGENDVGARPENRAIYRWWNKADGVFHVHGSLHGMHAAAGPWFLLDPAWVSRTQQLRERCRESSDALGYVLHDVERRGEKGFMRIERGFATRPNSTAMAQFFLEQGDPDMAGKFRPSSMESIRSLGGDPLTFVTEMPLFILPGVGEQIGPPDLVAERWKERLMRWRHELEQGRDLGSLREEAEQLGIRPMPIIDQMRLQWTFILSALETVAPEAGFRSQGF